ncbi:electron transfer flavoprotein subunit beta [Pseudomonas plecoglossicida]|uniref:phage tail terminator-like protein n=1 Tax=Pseudomonas plecoglossicida TaxID=70775 RepID=UPI000C7B3C28|nr:phage tail terminator-like protein [Pseudomonas plecoglossicida]PLU99924.1 electron transfer flavoprotein subunit beta [Pseudomonas plecoglossicida]PLV09184.1 electron transfer flavoprotein subunit beta [Pseudomonas plecoglossicida]
MTFEQIRAIVIGRMAQWTGIPADAVDYPNPPKPFDPAGRSIWARLADIPGLSSTPEVGIGPCVRRTGIIMVQLFVPSNKGTLAITKAADTLVQHFEFYSDPTWPFECYAASANTIGDDGHGWYQVNVSIPYRAY